MMLKCYEPNEVSTISALTSKCSYSVVNLPVNRILVKKILPNQYRQPFLFHFVK